MASTTGFINRGRQVDVGPCLAPRKTPATVDGGPHLASGHVARDQMRYLRTVHAGHLLDIASQQATSRLALLPILLAHQYLFYPAVQLRSTPAF